MQFEDLKRNVILNILFNDILNLEKEELICKQDKINMFGKRIHSKMPINDFYQPNYFAYSKKQILR